MLTTNPPAIPESQEASDKLLSGPIILVVDDSPVDRRLAAAILAKSGLRSVTASDGREAIDALIRHNPAAVVTDLQMPGMDGLELVEEIRRIRQGIPVVLMTGHGSEEIAFRALRAGAASYVPKKDLARDLADTVAGVLSAAAFDLRHQRLLSCRESSHCKYVLDNDPQMISPLIAALQEDLDEMHLCDFNQRTRVGVALQEALSNALFHGNLEVSSDLRQEDEREFLAAVELRRRQAPYRDRSIEITAILDRSSATYIVRDQGPGFPVEIVNQPFDTENLMRIGGRGLVLIRTFMDEVRHNSAGNEITMIKYRQSSTPPVAPRITP